MISYIVHTLAVVIKDLPDSFEWCVCIIWLQLMLEYYWKSFVQDLKNSIMMDIPL